MLTGDSQESECYEGIEDVNAAKKTPRIHKRQMEKGKTLNQWLELGNITEEEMLKLSSRFHTKLANQAKKSCKP